MDVFIAILFYVGLVIIGWKVLKIFIRYLKKRRIINRMSRSGIRDIDQMDGFQFEVYLEALFKKLGYRPLVTSASHDYGADLILKGRNKIVIQAKRYGMKNRVGISAVQEIYAARAYYKAHEAWVVTNSIYSPSARALAKACGVKLLDRAALQAFIVKVNPDLTASQVYHHVEPEERICPACGSDLVVRSNREGSRKFFGCTSFPQCRHTEPFHVP
ncbi:restriction endonuclease [Shouchella sp. 1P09AA]|uniref:restriction endonuclease n=1 Tax=unclassified Shouchella TaxID=2893065 RepID=UPI0039A3F325